MPKRSWRRSTVRLDLLLLTSAARWWRRRQREQAAAPAAAVGRLGRGRLVAPRQLDAECLPLLERVVLGGRTGLVGLLLGLLGLCCALRDGLECDLRVSKPVFTTPAQSAAQHIPGSQTTRCVPRIPCRCTRACRPRLQRAARSSASYRALARPASMGSRMLPARRARPCSSPAVSPAQAASRTSRWPRSALRAQPPKESSPRDGYRIAIQPQSHAAVPSTETSPRPIRLPCIPAPTCVVAPGTLKG